MADRDFDILLILLCLFPFGFDKLYKGSVKFFLLKFLLHWIGIGFIWWLYDLICAIIGRYRVNPFQ
ncbi:MAG TPA: NINE protein [Clostridia bacterium]